MSFVSHKVLVLLGIANCFWLQPFICPIMSLLLAISEYKQGDPDHSYSYAPNFYLHTGGIHSL